MDEAVRSLTIEGIYPGLQLPEATWRAIKRFADETPCFGDFDRRLDMRADNYVAAGRQFGRPLLSAHYFERVERCKEIVAVRNDPFLRALAARYFRSEPRLIGTRLWWEFPVDAAGECGLASKPTQERFHYDLDDWQVLKFFFYLTEVDLGSAPHVYVQKTHKVRLLRHQFSVFIGRSVPEVVAAYGPENVVTLVGPPGFGFVEDSFGYHRGARAERSPRLALEIAFGVSAAARPQFHGEPFLDPRTKLPPLPDHGAPRPRSPGHLQPPTEHAPAE